MAPYHKRMHIEIPVCLDEQAQSVTPARFGNLLRGQSARNLSASRCPGYSHFRGWGYFPKGLLWTT